MSRALSAGRLFKTRHGNGPARWSVDYRDASGRRKRVALSTDRGVAERMRIELIRARDLELAGLGSVEGQSRPLREVIDAFLADLSIRATSEHVRNTRAHLHRILRDIPAERVRDLKPHHVIAYRAQRIRDGASHQTAQHGVRSLKVALNWARDAGLIAENPIARLKPLRIDDGKIRRQRRALSDEEIARFLDAARADDVAMQRDRRAATIAGRGSGGPRSTRAPRVPQFPMWFAFVETGARYAELVNATWLDVDLDQRVLRLRGETTKSRKARVIPLRQELVDELRELRRVHEAIFGRPGARVFLSPCGLPWPDVSRNALRIFYRLAKRARLPRRDELGRCLDIHCLRRTCATRLARRGVPITTTQKLLGHASIEMTAAHYTDVELAEVRAAIESAPKNTTSPDVAESA